MINNENSNNTTSNKYQNKSILLIALSRHKKGLMLMVLVALISTSLAWFYQNLTVAMKVDGEVESWNVSVGESAVYNFALGQLKPGFTYNNSEVHIPVVNSGQTSAYLYLEIASVNLFNKRIDSSEYTIVKKVLLTDGREVDESEVENLLTPEELENSGSDETSLIQAYRHYIVGFPFTLYFDLPVVKLGPDQRMDISVSANWDFEGSMTGKQEMYLDEKGTLIPTGKIVPSCRANILSPDVLNYVDNQIEMYKNLDIFVDENPLNEDGTPMYEDLIVDNKYNMNTCDIIDTYYGEEATKFHNIVNSPDIQEKIEKAIDDAMAEEQAKKDLDENYKMKERKDININYIMLSNDNAEAEKFIVKDLFIELTMVISQGRN